MSTLLSRTRVIYAVIAVIVIAVGGAAAVTRLWSGQPHSQITLVYPQEGALFPPDFVPPTLEWRDASQNAQIWTIDVGARGGNAPSVHATSRGEPPQIGEIDQDAIGPTNKLPELAPERAAAHTWKPDAATWESIKRIATGSPAVLTITGYSGTWLRRAVSRGQATIQVSTDPVGAPVLYRDVPLRPSAGERGVIQPLEKSAIPLIAWRLRNLAEPGSRVLMKGLHTCTNCHSVSRDGKMMGLDVDGPRNNKGLYALFPIQPEAAIRKENVIEWSTFRGKLGGKLRVAFMSQVSPDGRYVVTMMSDPGRGQTDYQRRLSPDDLRQNYYVANFTDYRFLQVFYPTRGILAWYSKATGMLKPLPGADDPSYVHTGATWSPDGKFLVFARAKARASYPPGDQLATYANDPNETQIQYDLYRIPFNDGQGGKPTPIAGASANGMSNSFPKISPDGRWIVFVQAHNGLLMRPDGRLYIVPAEGGQARQMRANTRLMNSWHSFSPNGRWMVFSSKSRSPYTEMFLTHIDAEGNDTPAIVVENSTAANRAVNLPEFVNIPPGGLLKIDAPVAEYYRLIDLASEALDARRSEEALSLLRQAVESSPGDAEVHNSYGIALVAAGRVADATAQFRTAISLSPDYPYAHLNLASALAQSGQAGDAVSEFKKALALRPDYPEAQAGLGSVLSQSGRISEAIPLLLKSVQSLPRDAQARTSLSFALFMAGRPQEALPHAKEAVALSNGQNPRVLELLGLIYARTGRIADAIESTRRALDVAVKTGDRQLVDDLRARLASYRAATARNR
ncbi:MAG: tetratricopeptide repeat protein [Acidobacteria bacterium]|nr:tetratricopeptide repeat protein [Acidobacteriota bacterium]